MSFMQKLSSTLLVVVVCIIIMTEINAQQRVAPGVPPNSYQQPQHVQQQQFQGHPPPPQHVQHHQQQQQFVQHQPPQQHQPPPPQQHQQQQQFQHVNVQHGQGGHGHGHAPHQAGKPILDASNIALEREHIQEHVGVPNIDTSQMSEQELQFHYFKMHDSDNNNKLDGCELVKSLIHWHEHENEPMPEATSFTDEQLSTIVDQVLNYDHNFDGYISFGEFRNAQLSAAHEEEKKKHKCTTCGDR